MLYNASKTVSLHVLAATLLSLLLTGCGGQAAKQADNRPAAFWPPYPDEPRLQFLASYQRSTDIAPQQSSLDKLIAGGEPQKALGLAKPYGVAMWQGKIYICDLSVAGVTVLDLRNRQTLVIGRSGADKLQRPTAITIAPEGTKYVADMGAGLIFVYDAQDRHVKTFGHKDFHPVNVALWGNELYVPDSVAKHVEVFNRQTGELLRTFGEPGPDAGQFIMPLGIAVDKDGFVYVCDVLKCIVQKFDREGKLVSSFGTISNKAGGLVRPKHIAIDREGILYVVDSAFQNVQLFDANGQVLTFFGTPGAHPGAMYMPVGISIHEGDFDLFADKIHPAFQPERLVVVTNQFGDNKVSVYALGHLKPGMTVNDVSSSKGLVPTGTDDGSKNKLLLPATAMDSSAQAVEEKATTASDSPKPAAPSTAPAK